MQKIRIKRLSPLAAFLVALIVCAAACLITVSLHNSSGENGMGASRVNVSQVKSVEVLEEGLVYYNGTTLGYVDSSGSVKWTYMAGGDIRYQATKDGVAVWKGRTLTLLRIRNGSVYYSVTQPDDILAVSIGSQYAAVVYGDNMNSKVTLLNADGHFVKTLDLNAQLLLKNGFYSSGSYYWALALETNGTVAGTTVSTYKPASQLVSGSITDNSQVTYDCMFLDDRILCVGETYLKTYEYTGLENEDKRFLVYGWYMKDFDMEKDPTMLFLKDDEYSGESPVRDVMVIKGDSRRDLHFPFGCEAVFASEGNIYGFSSEDKCAMVIGPQSDIAKKIPVGLEYDAVYGVMDGGVAAVSAYGQMYLIHVS